jgi:hypothetical protein
VSDQETEGREQRSKIKLTRNAKGDPQWEISVLAGESDTALDEARRQAVAQWNALLGDLGMRS